MQTTSRKKWRKGSCSCKTRRLAWTRRRRCCHRRCSHHRARHHHAPCHLVHSRHVYHQLLQLCWLRKTASLSSPRPACHVKRSQSVPSGELPPLVLQAPATHLQASCILAQCHHARSHLLLACSLRVACLHACASSALTLSTTTLRLHHLSQCPCRPRL